MSEQFKSRVYTDRPAYVDYEPKEKFEAIEGIIINQCKCQVKKEEK